MDDGRLMTIADHIQKSLAKQIITGQLPPGKKLEEMTLASQFGVSRTPIREALRELSARGLIDLTPRRGGVVATIGVDKLADMLNAECELEGLCARLASQQMTPLERGQLCEIHERSQGLIDSLDESEYLTLNQQFHELICDAAHNKTLSDISRDLRERLGPFRQSQGGELAARLGRSYKEHGAIVSAIMNNNADAAYEAMRAHNARLSAGVIGLLRRDMGQQNARARG